ncbi:AraC family transcriptional regulator [Marinilabiliaceae bacterium ANBcel2]|nr:AraC family transcriptional regulator [Marinilabiliaceae bacterium ANBcel2]
MLHLLSALTPFYVTLFWCIILLSGGKRVSKSRFLLGLFMAASAILFFSHALFFLGYPGVYLIFDPLYLFTSLAVYPLYYWYVRMLTIESHFNFKNLLHLIPGFIFAISLSVLYIIATPEEIELYYFKVLSENDFSIVLKGDNVGFMGIVFFASRVWFSFQVFYCLIKGLLLIKRYNERVREFYSQTKGRTLFGVKTLLLVFLFTSMVSTTLNILGRGFFEESSLTLFIPSFLFSVLLFLIGYQGNIQQHTVADLEKEEAEAVPVVETCHKDTVLCDRLIELMEKEHIYRIHDLRISFITRKLNSNRSYISGVINEFMGESFNSFVNRYRIDYACKLMNDEKARNYSLEYISNESGFGSLSSFIRAFKHFKGVTPGKYLQNSLNKSDS